MLPGNLKLFDVVSKVRSVGYLIPLMSSFFNRIYAFEESGEIFYVRMISLGYLLTAKNADILINKLAFNANLVGSFSGRTLDALPPNPPKDIQDVRAQITPKNHTGSRHVVPQSHIRDSRKNFYKPISFSFNRNGKMVYCGFFGASKRTSNPSDLCNAFYTGACAIGATYTAILRNEQGNIKFISMTDSDAVVDKGYKIIAFRCEYDEHVYERLAKTFFEYNMPLFNQKLANNSVLFAVNVFKYYLHFGMQKYLKGDFASEALFKEFIITTYQHVIPYFYAYQKAGMRYGFNIEFFSPLDKVNYPALFDAANTSQNIDITDPNFDIQRFSDEMIIMMDRIPGKTPEQKEQALVRAILKTLCTPYESDELDYTAEVYGSLDDAFIESKIFSNTKNDKAYSPLVNLNKLDYSAMLAVCQLKCANHGKLLGILPVDERKVFDDFEKHFSKKYGSFEYLLWMPPILPQTGEGISSKYAKAFYMDYGITTLIEMIPEILPYQAMIAYAIEHNILNLFLKGVEGLSNLLSARADHIIDVSLPTHNKCSANSMNL